MGTYRNKAGTGIACQLSLCRNIGMVHPNPLTLSAISVDADVRLLRDGCYMPRLTH